MEDEEIWKPYPEFEWIEGSNLGNVRTLDHYVKDKRCGKRLVKGNVLSQYRGRDGYLRVHSSLNGKQICLLVHRIIAACFLPNPDDFPEVNHKNAVRNDNRVKNLEWCTHQENVAYRDKLGHTNYKDNAPKLPVIAINLKILEVLRFSSQNEAARQLGVDDSNINKVIKGKRKTHKGYWFTNADKHAVENTSAKFGDEVANKVAKLMEGDNND